MRTQKRSVKLEDWAVVPSLKNGKYQELSPGNLLVGRAFGHRRIKSGTFIFTSPIGNAEHFLSPRRGQSRIQGMEQGAGK